MLVTLSFPKFDFGVAAWFALVPLFLALEGKSALVSFLLAFSAGALAMMGVFFWANFIKGFGVVDFLLLAAYLGTFYGLFGYCVNRVARKGRVPLAFSIPILWVFFEYLRSHAGFLALPWGLVGQSQYGNLPVIQIASITGVYGVSFLVVGFNAALSELIRHCARNRQADAGPKRFRHLAPSVLMLIGISASLGFGFNALAGKKAVGHINVTVVQGNIPQKIKWDPASRNSFHKKHMDLSVAAANAGRTDLIVWPESAILGHLSGNLPLTINMLAFVNRLGVPLVAGSSPGPKASTGESASTKRTAPGYNSAYFISPLPKIEGRYDKIHLLPFGEYLPYRNVFPWPAGYGPKVDFLNAGREHTLFTVIGLRFGTTICWESIFPDLFRAFVRNGADFMLNIANEAHFGDTAAPHQFVMLNVFRAVENRVSLARAANTGVSCLITPYGEVLGRVKEGDKDVFVGGFLTRSLPIVRKRTFYTAYGDVFAWTLNVLSVLMIAASCGRTSR